MSAFMYVKWVGPGPAPKDAYYAGAKGNQEHVKFRAHPYCFGEMTAHILDQSVYKHIQSAVCVPYEGPFNTRFAPDEDAPFDWSEQLDFAYANAPSIIKAQFRDKIKADFVLPITRQEVKEEPAQEKVVAPPVSAVPPLVRRPLGRPPNKE